MTQPHDLISLQGAPVPLPPEDSETVQTAERLAEVSDIIAESIESHARWAASQVGAAGVALIQLLHRTVSEIRGSK